MVVLIVTAAVAAWIAVMALVVCLCIVAGRADRRSSPVPLLTTLRLRPGSPVGTGRRLGTP